MRYGKINDQMRKLRLNSGNFYKIKVKLKKIFQILLNLKLGYLRKLRHKGKAVVLTGKALPEIWQNLLARRLQFIAIIILVQNLTFSAGADLGINLGGGNAGMT